MFPWGTLTAGHQGLTVFASPALSPDYGTWEVLNKCDYHEMAHEWDSLQDITIHITFVYINRSCAARAGVGESIQSEQSPHSIRVVISFSSVLCP